MSLKPKGSFKIRNRKSKSECEGHIKIGNLSEKMAKIRGPKSL